MDPSSFAKILQELVGHLPGARGAVFLDWEGEAVDAFSSMSESGIRLFGAHWGIVFKQAKLMFDKLKLGTTSEVLIRLEDLQVIIRRVADDYIVVLSLDADSNLGRALRLMNLAEAKLLAEMG